MRSALRNWTTALLYAAPAIALLAMVRLVDGSLAWVAMALLAIYCRGLVGYGVRANTQAWDELEQPDEPARGSTATRAHLQREPREQLPPAGRTFRRELLYFVGVILLAAAVPAAIACYFLWQLILEGAGC